ncbi:MAG: hypothetical protein ACKO5K_13775 [Armatimonadota bacterium]
MRRRFPLVLGAVAVVLLALGSTVWGWRLVRIGPLLLRYHILTVRVEIRPPGEPEWRTSFLEEPGAAPVRGSLLREVALDQLQWGVGGLLVGRAVTGPHDVSGRLAVNLVLLEPNGTRVRERSLRATVRWPKESGNWFVLDTGLGVPDTRLRTVVVLEAIQ